MNRVTPLHSLRTRLTLACSLLVALAMGATFTAVYAQTGHDLRHRIDRELGDEAAAFLRQGVPAGTSAPQAVASTGRAYIAGQPFRASSRLLLERIPGFGTLTNQPELVRPGADPGEPRRRQQVENRQAGRLLAAPLGYSTVNLGDLGPVRLLTRPVERGGRRVATIVLGEPLEPVERAQQEVATTFAVAGSIALALALLASYLIASRMLGPLRRISAIAARVDAGELSRRIGATGTRDEVRILADSFDHMLDRLQQAFDRQTSFLADASHELRTPLTVLRGQLEVLARDPQFSREEFMRVQLLAEAEILRMQKLVDELLLIAHSREPRFLHPESIRLDGYLEGLLDGVRPTADRRFELAVRGPGRLSADPDRLAQALRNLIANAIQHTDAGGLIRLTSDADDGRVVIGVEDDGPGIPEPEREAVFERFHRTDSSRTRSAGGAGLGLTIVEAIAAAHGGAVDVETAPGGGARVSVTLPGFTPD